jgi:spermidine/putrescine transport system permease protein
MATAQRPRLRERLETGFWYGYTLLMILFLMLPLLSLVVASFNNARIFALPYEPTLQWYEQALTSSSVRNAIVTTFRISIPVVILSTIIGTSAAIAYTRYTFRGKGLFKLVVLLPIFFPLVLLGLGMSMWTNIIDLGYGIWPTVIGETVWISPIVMFVVSITALGLDPNIENAARDLGADNITLYKDVVLPLIKDGIVAGAIFAFVLSWNNYYIASYLSGSEITITTWIHGRMTQGFTPTVPALTATIFYVSLLLLVAAFLLEIRSIAGEE